jgi:hypothetical protein
LVVNTRRMSVGMENREWIEVVKFRIFLLAYGKKLAGA